jgi:hypothetical protein
MITTDLTDPNRAPQEKISISLQWIITDAEIIEFFALRNLRLQKFIALCFYARKTSLHDVVQTIAGDEASQRGAVNEPELQQVWLNVDGHGLQCQPQRCGDRFLTDAPVLVVARFEQAQHPAVILGQTVDVHPVELL